MDQHGHHRIDLDLDAFAYDDEILETTTTTTTVFTAGPTSIYERARAFQEQMRKLPTGGQVYTRGRRSFEGT